MSCRRSPAGPTAPSSVSWSRKSWRSAPSSNTCRLLARDHAAPESTLALSKAHQPCCGRVRPLAWCSRPGNSTALLEGALMAVATRQEFGLFINGELVEPASGEIRDLAEPATGEPLARAAMGGEADIDRAVDAARSALEGPWGKTPPTERSRLLHALADAIVANRKELAELEVRNVGKALSSVKAEHAQAVENFRFYASAIASIAGRSNPIGGARPFYSLKEPAGALGPIARWEKPPESADLEPA